MRIAPELLVDGCVQTLLSNVLPALESRFARGQLYAVLDVLQNLRDRVEEKRSFAEAEASSAESALQRAVEALRSSGAHADSAAIAASLGSVANSPPEARRETLNQAFVEALVRVTALPDAEGASAHAALGGHIAAQAIRDLATLKPSLLEEISRG